MGSKGFIEKTKAELRGEPRGRRIAMEVHVLREPPAYYPNYFNVKNGDLRFGNTYLWNVFLNISI